MNRTRAREVALKCLYAKELGGECSYRAALQARDDEDDLSLKPMKEDEVFCQKLVDGSIENQLELDDYIVSQSRGWKLERIACLDRNILRIAIYEMLFCDDTPTSVSINEAVELAKSYGADDKAGAFVNGVLGAIARKLSQKDTEKLEEAPETIENT